MSLSLLFLFSLSISLSVSLSLVFCIKQQQQQTNNVFAKNLRYFRALHETKPHCYFTHKHTYYMRFEIFRNSLTCSRGCSRSILLRPMRQIQCSCYGIAWSITWRFVRYLRQTFHFEERTTDSYTISKYNQKPIITPNKQQQQ